ncbi:unnamed protein product [Ceratitis capitata]|uniref:(Mediterranean fruit fly) hypothetical protein n=1 Tax=Ceratitis capitata TaxID=7213 RepID=A0A811UNS7_CERCA|nr:unnamed protein product [Ceratitis capitata]
MLNNNNNNDSQANGSTSNCHLPNGHLSSMSPAAAAPPSPPPQSFLDKAWNWADAIRDFLWFIICSIGYILQK